MEIDLIDTPTDPSTSSGGARTRPSFNIKFLSRLDITGPLNEKTPICVLEELADCHQIPLDLETLDVHKFEAEVLGNPVGPIHEPILDRDMCLVIRYINPATAWNFQDLLLAYEFLQKWTLGPELPKIPADITYARQTAMNPENMNACVLYRICTAYNMKLENYHTMYQMAIAISMLTQNELQVRSILYNTLAHLPCGRMMDIYMYMVKELPSPRLVEIPERTSLALPASPPIAPDELTNYESIETCYENFSKKDNLRLRIDPQSNSEAIVLAALNYHLDLSNAHNVIYEYNLLRLDPASYYPQDPQLQEIVENNSILLDLKETFNPLLPPTLYDETALMNMALLEGYQQPNFRHESPYSLLQTAYMSNTFYSGKQPGIINTRTHFSLETIGELASEFIICFGVRACNSMTAFTHWELAGLFNKQRNFNNPLIPDDTFPDIAIRKLKNLCKTVRLTDTPELLEEKQRLYDSIITAELFTQEANSKAKEFYEIFSKADEPTKMKIRGTIEALFHLAMYMRGWLGDGPYPIEKAPVDNQTIVDLKVTEGVATFDFFCQDLGPIGKTILDLPLLQYRANQFQAITSTADGKTIGERLIIVKSGDDHPNYNSCIRLSSNFLAISSYRYMEILGMRPPFKVERLRDIS